MPSTATDRQETVSSDTNTDRTASTAATTADPWGQTAPPKAVADPWGQPTIPTSPAAKKTANGPRQNGTTSSLQNGSTRHKSPKRPSKPPRTSGKAGGDPSWSNPRAVNQRSNAPQAPSTGVSADAPVDVWGQSSGGQGGDPWQSSNAWGKPGGSHQAGFAPWTAQGPGPNTS